MALSETFSEYLEKASKYKIGDVDAKNPNYVVTGFNAKGQPIWKSKRKLQGGSSDGGSGGSIQSSSSDSSSGSADSTKSSIPNLKAYANYGKDEYWHNAIRRAQEMTDDEIIDKRANPRIPDDLDQILSLEQKRREGKAEKDPFDLDNDDYVEPIKRIQSYNRKIRQFIATNNESMFVYGKGGLGKTFNMQEQLEAAGKIEFNSQEMTPGSDDYDWVKIGNISSDSALYETLFKHNGKIIVFDDSDGILEDSNACNTLKNAMDTTKPGKKRKVGRTTTEGAKRKVTKMVWDEEESEWMAKMQEVPDSFEFDGKIAFISNFGWDKFDPEIEKNSRTRSPLLQRGIAVELSFSKKETLSLVSNYIDSIDYSGLIEPTTFDIDKQAFLKEKKDVYQVIENNIDKIPVANINMRILRSLINTKRTIEDHNNVIDAFTDPKSKKNFTDTYGGKENWQKEVLRTLKGGASMSKAIAYKEIGVNTIDLLKAELALFSK
jgi:hypothetical protein